uniref:Uncharacterized protein n=1 Tax=Arundo donax TaxID=35708 RepID=A0A0A8Z8I2_ARUDO
MLAFIFPQITCCA